MSQLLFITGCLATHTPKANFIYRFEAGADSVGAEPEKQADLKKAPPLLPFIDRAMAEARTEAVALTAQDAFKEARKDGLSLEKAIEAAQEAAQDAIADQETVLGSVDPQKRLAAKETANALQQERIRTFHELLRNAEAGGFLNNNSEAQLIAHDTLGSTPDLRQKMRGLEVDDDMKAGALKSDAELTSAVLRFAANLTVKPDMMATLAGKNTKLKKILEKNSTPLKRREDEREKERKTEEEKRYELAREEATREADTRAQRDEELRQEPLVASKTAAPKVRGGRRLGAAGSGGERGGRAFDPDKAAPSDLKARADYSRRFIKDNTDALNSLNEANLEDDTSLTARVTQIQKSLLTAAENDPTKFAKVKAIIDKSGPNFVDGWYGLATLTAWREFKATNKAAPAAAPVSTVRITPELTTRVDTVPKGLAIGTMPKLSPLVVRRDRVVLLPDRKTTVEVVEAEKIGGKGWKVKYINANGKPTTQVFPYINADNFIKADGSPSYVVAAADEGNASGYIAERQNEFHRKERSKAETELMKKDPDLYKKAQFEALVPRGTPTEFIASNGVTIKTHPFNVQLTRKVGVLEKVGEYYKVVRDDGLVTFVNWHRLIVTPRKAAEK